MDIENCLAFSKVNKRVKKTRADAQYFIKYFLIKPMQQNMIG
ncbi:MAG TPA: hypothetical protein VIM59_00720 [Cellvibrio sp.]